MKKIVRVIENKEVGQKWTYYEEDGVFYEEYSESYHGVYRVVGRVERVAESYIYAI